MKRALIAATLAACALALPGGAVAEGTGAHRIARLSGDGFQEGDPNASGRTDLKIRPARGTICFRITFKRMIDPNYGAILSGSLRYGGALEVTLFNGDRGMRPSPIEGCARNLEPRLLRSIRDEPRRFYVQIDQHSYANSAIRGRIRRP
ncbi:MAG: hypothetical protein M3198_17320 [Actinomycetota bacterium]|nr:hypothetical protein [Actinomycetota bacterium]